MFPHQIVIKIHRFIRSKQILKRTEIGYFDFFRMYQLLHPNRGFIEFYIQFPIDVYTFKLFLSE